MPIRLTQTPTSCRVHAANIASFQHEMLTVYASTGIVAVRISRRKQGNRQGCSVLSYIGHFGDLAEAAKCVGVAVLAD
jgi:hypothetical protein